MAKEQLKNVKGFIAANNYNIIKVEENYCELEGKVTEHSYNPYGIVHGGYIFGLADTACGIAARSTGRTAVTSSASIEYLRACKSAKIKAVAKAIKVGSNLSFYEVFLYDTDDNLIAKSDMSYFYLDK